MKSIEDVVEQSTEPLTELAKQTQAASEQAIEAISEVTKSNQKLAKSSTAMIDGMQKANEALSAMTNITVTLAYWMSKYLKKSKIRCLQSKMKSKQLMV